MSVTLVFAGAARAFDGNPFDIETPYGKPQTISIGDTCEMADIMQAALEAISEQDGDPLELARAALREVDDLMAAEVDAARAKRASP